MGVCIEKGEEPPTTLIIGHFDREEPKNVISKLMAHFSKVVSEPKDIVFGEDGPEILFEWAQENTKLMSRLVKDPQIFWELKETNYSILQWNEEHMLQIL